jgi:sugar phosphate permease
MKQKTVFYGWTIVACAFFTLLVTNGLTFSGMMVFDESMLREFGWTRGALKFRDLLTMALAGLLSPLAGAIADKYGLKAMMIGGALLLTGSLLLYGQIGSAMQMYGIHILFAVVLATCGIVMAVILVTRWFVKYRGTATGIVMVGTSMGGAIYPAIGASLLNSYSWRTSLMIFAAFPALLVVVLALFVRERPSDMGLLPLGAEATGPGKTFVAGGMDYSDAIRTPSFWLIAFAGMCTFYSILGVSSNLILHLRGMGYSIPDAAHTLSWLFMMGLAGKFLFGYLADHFDHKRVLQVNLVIMLAGSLALASVSAAAIWPFIILFGLGWGGIYTLLQLLTMDAFGLKAAGRILGTRTVIDSIGGGLGPFVTGYLFDRTGAYQVSFLVVSGLVVATIVAASFLRIEAPAAAKQA